VLPELMPAKRPDVLTADFETELVVLVPEQRTAHRLDEGLSLLLDASDGVTPTADVVAEVCAATGQIEADVCSWMEDGLGQLRALDVFVADDHQGHPRGQA
jgi:hypothetical protein